MKYVRFGVLLSALALVGLEAVAQPLQKVNVGHTNGAADAGIFVADSLGYFRDEGIEINLIAFDSGAKMIVPFASGDLDVGGGATSAGLYNAVARGIKVKIVADKTSTPPGRPGQSLMIRKDLVESGRYKQLADLKGLKLASTAQGSASHGTVFYIHERTGIKVGDITRIYMGYPQQYLAMSNGAIDASLTTEPTATEMEEKGIARRMMGDDEIYPNHQISVILYSPKFAAKKDVATRFMRAYIRGMRSYNDGIELAHLVGPKGEEIIKILIKYAEIKDPAIYRKMSVNACDPDGRLDLPSLKFDLEVFRKEGLIEAPVELSDALDTSFLEAAVKQLGPYVPNK